MVSTPTATSAATRIPAASEQRLGSSEFPWGHSLARVPVRPEEASNSMLVRDGAFLGVSDDEWCQAGVPQDILFKAQSQVQICTWALSLQRVDGVTLAPGLHVRGSPGPPPSARLCQAPDVLCSVASRPQQPDEVQVWSECLFPHNSHVELLPQPEVMCGWASGGGSTHQLRVGSVSL